MCNKLERVNLSNNKITADGFAKLVYAIASSRSLKML
jgi:Ran GTPase-activating protein (RanGAP) involved in mRNA processing and transport